MMMMMITCRLCALSGLTTATTSAHHQSNIHTRGDTRNGNDNDRDSDASDTTFSAVVVMERVVEGTADSDEDEDDKARGGAS